MSYEFLKKVMLSTKIEISDEQDYFRKVFDNHKMSDIEFEIKKNEDENSTLKVVLFKDGINNPKVKIFKDNKDKTLEDLNFSTQFDIISNDWSITEDENEFQAYIEFKPKIKGSSKISISDTNDTPDLSKYDIDTYGDRFDKSYSKAKKGGKIQKKIQNLRYATDILESLKREFYKYIPQANIRYADGDSTGALMGGYNSTAGFPVLEVQGTGLGFSLTGDLDNTNYKLILVRDPYRYHYSYEPKDIIQEFALQDFENIFNTYFKDNEDIELDEMSHGIVNPKGKTVTELFGRNMSDEIWEGDFALNGLNDSFNVYLNSLEGMPKEITGDLYLGHHCTKTSKGCTQKVNGNFKMWVPGLRTKNLTGFPEYVGKDYTVYQCRLTSLKGSPEHIYGNFDCSYNRFSDFKGSPRKVEGDFTCSSREYSFHSLEGLPEYVGGTLKLTLEPFGEDIESILDNLVHLPKTIGGLILYTTSWYKIDKDAIKDGIQELINKGLLEVKGTIEIK